MKALALLSCTLEKITSRWFLYVEQVALRAKVSYTVVLYKYTFVNLLLTFVGFQPSLLYLIRILFISADKRHGRDQIVLCFFCCFFICFYI